MRHSCILSMANRGETFSELDDAETGSFGCLYAAFLNQRNPANRYLFHAYMFLGESRA